MEIPWFYCSVRWEYSWKWFFLFMTRRGGIHFQICPGVKSLIANMHLFIQRKLNGFEMHKFDEKKKDLIHLMGIKMDFKCTPNCPCETIITLFNYFHFENKKTLTHTKKMWIQSKLYMQKESYRNFKYSKESYESLWYFLTSNILIKYTNVNMISGYIYSSFILWQLYTQKGTGVVSRTWLMLKVKSNGAVIYTSEQR